MINKFNIFGTVWKIVYLDDLIRDDEGISFGECESAKHIIKIVTKDSGKNLPKEEVELTLLHEIIHAILITGQYLNCNNDEPLVEWVARCINSLRKQKII